MSAIVVEITFPDPKKLPTFLRLYDGLRRPDVRKVMGRSLVTLLRHHFTEMDKTHPNKLGGQRTHFWGKARRSVQQPELIGGDGVKVAITQQGVAQRYYGGDIEAKDKPMTIPVHPAAYGHRAREFDDLDYIPSKGKALAILARPNPASPHGIGEVYYVLTMRVHQDPDPSVLPTDAQMQQTALDAGDKYLNHLILRSMS